MEEIANRVIQGNTLNVLAQMSAKTVNMCVTSPPYWSLRDYSDEAEAIWNGDDGCNHEWGVRKTEKYQAVHQGRAQRPWQEKMDMREKDYGCWCKKCGAWKGQLGMEPAFDLYITHLCDIFDEVKRVLRDDGTLWVVIGDTYGTQGGQNRKTDKDYSHYDSIKLENREIGTELTKERGYHKCLLQIPSRFAIEMIDRGWTLRNEIIWHKPNCMPSSAKDRFTVDFEKVFFFSKNKQYHFDQQFEKLKTGEWDRMPPIGGIKQSEGNINLIYSGNRPPSNPKGRNKRAVWGISTKGFSEAHFALYPEKLIEPMVKAGCPKEVCSECGFIRERVTEVERKSLRPGISSKYNDGQTQYSLEHNLKKVRPIDRQTTGWTSCECDAEYKSGIVLDPFMGAGTTAVVAEKLGRQWIGIEIVKEYVDMSYNRLAKVNSKYRKFVSGEYYNQKIEKDKKQSEEKGQKLLF